MFYSEHLVSRYRLIGYRGYHILVSKKAKIAYLLFERFITQVVVDFISNQYY